MRGKSKTRDILNDRELLVSIFQTLNLMQKYICLNFSFFTSFIEESSGIIDEDVGLLTEGRRNNSEISFRGRIVKIPTSIHPPPQHKKSSSSTNQLSGSTPAPFSQASFPSPQADGLFCDSKTPKYPHLQSNCLILATTAVIWCRNHCYAFLLVRVGVPITS